jgi:hypothetical protein
MTNTSTYDKVRVELRVFFDFEKETALSISSPFHED